MGEHTSNGVREFTRDDLAEVLNIPFSDPQFAAISAPLEPCVVVAGAGSGKTSVMAARAVWLVARGLVQPDQILGLTFTNKAAGELSDRVRRGLAALEEWRTGLSGVGTSAEPVPDPVISTYHSFAQTLVAEHGLRIGIEPGGRLLSETASRQLAHRVVSRLWQPKHSTANPASASGMTLHLDDELAEQVLDTDRAREHCLALVADVGALPKLVKDILKLKDVAEERVDLLDAVDSLRAERARLGVATFADLMRFGSQIALLRPEVGQIMRERYPVVLLDEYQDTSVAQRVMLAALFAEEAVISGAVPDLRRTSPTGHPVMAVGDPFQAIYGWRGASVDNIDRFRRHFARADRSDAGTYSLMENRRSGPLILHGANHAAQDLRVRHPQVEPLVPAATAHGAGEIRIALHERWVDEVEWVADQVAAQVGSGVKPKDIAVLGTKNANLGPVYQALRVRGIPVHVVGLGGLLTFPDVRDVVAMLRVISDPAANTSVVRLLSGPRWAIGPRDLALLGQRARVLSGGRRHDDPAPLEDRLEVVGDGGDPADLPSLGDALDDLHEAPVSPEARRRMGLLAAELRGLRKHIGEPLVDFVARVVSTMGLDVEVLAAEDSIDSGRHEAVAGLLAACASFASPEGHSTLAAFLDFLSAVEEFGKDLDAEEESAPDAVQLMTVHKSKGLERDVIAVVGVSKGQFPSKNGRPRWTKRPEVVPHPLRGDAHVLPQLVDLTTKGLAAFDAACKDDDFLEQLRLGYVAFTRPHRVLIASGCWWGPTQKSMWGPSELLSSLHDYLVAEGADPVHWEPQPMVQQNPYLADAGAVEWPEPVGAAQLRLRETVERVREQMALEQADGSGDESPVGSVPDHVAAQIADWDDDIAAVLAAELASREGDIVVRLPDTLSASAVMALAKDPADFALDLRRPVPREPNPAARLGTEFHAWVEGYYKNPGLLSMDDIAAVADPAAAVDPELKLLQEAFLRSEFADASPTAVEVEFTILVGGRVIRGVIDAVFRQVSGDGAVTWQVVDWKTNKTESADPLQLSIYRLAWAQHTGADLDAVDAVFHYVRLGTTRRPSSFLTEAELDERIAAEPLAASVGE